VEPNDRENSSVYVNNPNEAAEWRQKKSVSSNNSGSQKPKKNKAVRVLAGLLALALLLVVVFGYLWNQEAARADAAAADLEEANTQLAQLKQAFEAEDEKLDADTSGDETTIDASTGDAEAIVSAALAVANASVSSEGVQVELAKQVGDFARVNVTGDTSGYSMILKKSNDQWVSIVSGQAPPAQEDIDRYGIPQEVIES
jgi:type II secretory pathway component PulM